MPPDYLRNPRMWPKCFERQRLPVKLVRFVEASRCLNLILAGTSALGDTRHQRNPVLTTQPATEVDHLAAVRTERKRVVVFTPKTGVRTLRTHAVRRWWFIVH